MRRRLILVAVLATALAACGGSTGSPSPSGSGASPATASSSPSGPAGASSEPTASGSEAAASPSAALPAGSMTAICDGISLRKAASSSGAKLKVINSGTAVHVVATVDGTAYTAGSCGTSGSSWLKIDQVGGKAVKSLYKVNYVYAAAGFFQ